MNFILLKVSIFLLRHDDVVFLNDHLTTRFTLDLDDAKHRPLILPRLSTFSNLYYALTYGVGATYLLSNFIIPILALRRGKYVPCTSVRYPVSFEPGDPIYWTAQLVTATGGFFVWMATCGVDSMFGLYALQLCGEFKVLTKMFEELRSSEDYRMDLRECIKRHHLLMKSRDAMQRLFGLLSIWLAVTSAIVLCTIVFQAMQVR